MDAIDEQLIRRLQERKRELGKKPDTHLSLSEQWDISQEYKDAREAEIHEAQQQKHLEQLRFEGKIHECEDCGKELKPQRGRAPRFCKSCK